MLGPGIGEGVRGEGWGREPESLPRHRHWPAQHVHYLSVCLSLTHSHSLVHKLTSLSSVSLYFSFLPVLFLPVPPSLPVPFIISQALSLWVSFYLCSHFLSLSFPFLSPFLLMSTLPLTVPPSTALSLLPTKCLHTHTLFVFYTYFYRIFSMFG